MKRVIILIFLSACELFTFGQNHLILSDKRTGLKLSVINKDYPLLKLLLPNQPDTERGIEIEFPEHVTGLNRQNRTSQHLYLVSLGKMNKRTAPVWKISHNALTYESILNDGMKLIAKVTLDTTGLEYSYTFTNQTNTVYEHLQAVTCVKLYSEFSDTLLERFYIHDKNGFELLAAETPERLTMPLNKWLPCRYLVSYTWPIPNTRVQKDEDGITRYYKSTKADKPFIATLSHDKKWVAATYTAQTGNMWSNPERSCQHADPEMTIAPHETKMLTLKTFVYKGPLDKVLKYITN